MKRLTLLSVFVFLFYGCDHGEEVSTLSEPLSATFQLTDTLGHDTTSFRSNRNFDISFRVTNTTGKRLTYYRGNSGPDVIFKIIQADTIVATSTDGYAFLMVATVGHLEPGQTMQGQWRAPNTPARIPKLVLTPGSYKVQTFFPRFDEVEVKELLPISFSINP
jgi:hypothetical protein